MAILKSSRLQHWAGAIPIGIALVLLTWMSWRKWPDVLIDFGQQLYVPWRLSQGAMLYRDVAYLFGCLSSCYHALLFSVFGVSLNILVVSNFLIVIALLTIIYRCFLRTADMLVATTAGLLVVIMATGQFLDVGNYNYLCPYSHEVFHGMVLAVVMTASLSRWLETKKHLPLAVGGFCWSLTLLTKPEIFLATTALAVFAVVAADVRRRISGTHQYLPRYLVGYMLAGLFTLLPLAGFFIYFNWASDSHEALRAIFGAWLPVISSKGLSVPFYQSGAGLDAPWFHVGRMLIEFGTLALIVAICAWRLGRSTVTSIERLIIFVAVGAVGINYDWHRAGHSLPLIIVCAAILLWVEWRSSPSERRTQFVFPALWLVLSLFLTAKMGLNARIEHYGVFLALPGCLSVIYLLLHLLPRFIERRGLIARNFRAAMVILLLTAFSRLTIQSALFYKDKDLSLGAPRDRIIAYNPKVDPAGAAMAAAVNWIETNTAPTNTLAVLPEGAMLNYLTRRANPTPYIMFLLEVSIFGEQPMLDAFQKTPPDYVVLIHRESAELGFPYFGLKKGYGFDTMQWINRNYEPVLLIGSEPLKTKDFGIKILRKATPGG